MYVVYVVYVVYLVVCHQHWVRCVYQLGNFPVLVLLFSPSFIHSLYFSHFPPTTTPTYLYFL